MNNKRKIVTDVLGSYRRAGDEHLYHCPFCKHHKRKMSVNFSINSWKCWVCDESGKRISSLLYKLGYSRMLVEAGLTFLNNLIENKMIYNL